MTKSEVVTYVKPIYRPEEKDLEKRIEFEAKQHKILNAAKYFVYGLGSAFTLYHGVFGLWIPFMLSYEVLDRTARKNYLEDNSKVMKIHKEFNSIYEECMRDYINK